MDGNRGFGDIAQHTARLCRAFGMRVMAWRNRKNLPGNDLADIVTYASDGPSAKEDVGQGGLKWKDVVPVQLEWLKWVRKMSMCIKIRRCLRYGNDMKYHELSKMQ